MIVLTCINEKRKRVDIIKMDGYSAINYIRRVYEIPPQRRYVRIIAYKTTTTYDEVCYSGYIDKMISKMIPTLQELFMWKTYPIYFHTRRTINYG